MSDGSAGLESSSGTERRLPPVTGISVATLIAVVIGGICVAVYLPDQAPLWLPILFLGVAGALLVLNVILLVRLREFAWDRFFLVGKWALVAYLVIGGMLEYVFVADHTPRNLLVLLSSMLLVFAIDVPLLFAFSVARYQQPSPQERHEAATGDT
jgi:hypothetical protein